MTPTEDHSRSGWRYYLQRPVLVIFFLGFSGGLPFPLVYSTLTYWLAEADIVRSTISTFAWLGFAYSFKLFWSPLVDWGKFPILSNVLGRRRSWLLVCQVALLASLVLLANTDPSSDMVMFALIAVMVAFFSATQDIVIDAYRIESAEVRLQGVMAAAYQYGYRVAVIVATAGALFIAEATSWSTAYQVMAICMTVGVLTTLLCNEPTTQGALPEQLTGSWSEKTQQWIYVAMVQPFVDFVQRYGKSGFLCLAFIGSFYISDRVLGIMAMPFYEDIGFTKPQVATIAKFYGLWISILGAAVGAVAVVKYGLARCVVVASVLIVSTNLFFVLIALSGAQLALLTLTISFDNLALGFGSTVMIAYMSSLVNAKFTATQYALFSSINTFFGKLLAGFSGDVQLALGWINFFFYAAATGIPAVILALLVARQLSKESQA
ncbi:MAG: AmpG family muropeptide MFS transporter [Woeseia sp.]|nr:AmpG family muropeptide MFS transporter [Woeseia sp.]|tara:strand:- start:279 stop:1583 length:1305 start_codon:yes stop_codon:yes gene_type:complete